MSLFENLLLELFGGFVDGGMSNEDHAETDINDFVNFSLLVHLFVNLTQVLSQKNDLLAE